MVMSPAEIIALLGTIQRAGNGITYASHAAEGIYNDLVHSGKEDLGKFYLQDSNYRTWKVKVRTTGNRGRYLKVKCKTLGMKRKVSADGYKPGKYLQIASEEWIAFAVYAETQDSRLLPCIGQVLNRLATNTG